jgi:hypothetical protein
MTLRLSPRHALIVAVPILLAVLIYLFWHQLMLVVIGVTAWRLLLHHAGIRRRPGSFARNVTALSAAYAAWNSRWIKHAATNPIRVSVHKDAKGAYTGPDGVTRLSEENWGDVPF